MEPFNTLFVPLGQGSAICCARYGLKRSGREHVLALDVLQKGFKTADEALTSIADSSVVSIDALTPHERKTINNLFEKMLNDFEKRLPEEGGSDSTGTAETPRRKINRARR